MNCNYEFIVSNKSSYKFTACLIVTAIHMTILYRTKSMNVPSKDISQETLSIGSFDVRFEVFTAVTMKNGVFWDVTPCGSCKN
jgi:hypothetical protein